MTKYEHKVLVCKPVGLTAHWFDGTEDLGTDLSSGVLTALGLDGWQVVTTMNSVGGHTSGVILTRPVSA